MAAEEKAERLRFEEEAAQTIAAKEAARKHLEEATARKAAAEEAVKAAERKRLEKEAAQEAERLRLEEETDAQDQAAAERRPLVGQSRRSAQPRAWAYWMTPRMIPALVASHRDGSVAWSKPAEGVAG